MTRGIANFQTASQEKYRINAQFAADSGLDIALHELNYALDYQDGNKDKHLYNDRNQFQYLSKKARILRESSAFDAAGGGASAHLTTGGYTSKLQNVGKYVETTSKLIPRLDIGIYKDLAFYFKVPIILANSRRLDEPEEYAGNPNAVVGAEPGQILFGLPFNAPDRSGVEHLALGLDLGIFNQARDYTKPTWVLGLETRLSVGEPMHACNANPANGELECAHPGDINRNGEIDADASGNSLESSDISERGAGVTRGTVGLELHTVMSKRLKYIEPYGGLKALFEFQMGNDSEYGQTDLEGALVNHPPIVGKVFVGMMIHPWENRESYNRLTFDLRFEGDYHSEGRDYGELFDALGSSAAPSMRNPKWERYEASLCEQNGTCTGAESHSVIDEGSGKVYQNGLTVVEPFGSYRASGSVTWRAHEYVKFNTGVGLSFEQAHGISHDQPCNPDFDGTVGEAGPCHSGGGNTITATGNPNPNYRPVVNAIGRRFYVDESITYEIFASGTVMF